MHEYYKEDLAYIHDVGFRDYCLKSTPGILEILRAKIVETLDKIGFQVQTSDSYGKFNLPPDNIAFTALKTN